MKRQYWALLVVAVFALVSWRGILFAPGHVYQNWDRVPTPYPEEMRQVAAISKHAWAAKYDMGAPGAFSGITRWFDIATRDLGSYIGGPVIVRWEGPAYAVVGAGGIVALCRVLGLGLGPSVVAAMLYAFNPRQFSMVLAGHVEESGFALMLLPWILLLLARAGATDSRRRGAAMTLGAGMLGGLACSASPFGIVFYGTFTLLFAVAETAARRSLRPALAFAVAGLVALTLHVQWLAPAATSIVKGADFKHHQTAEEISGHYHGIYKRFSAPLRQAMLGHTDNYGMGTEYAYPVDTRETPAWVAAALGVLGLALVGFAYRSRHRGLKYFAGLCLLAGFILMAGNKTLAGAVFYERILNRVSILFFQMARPARWLPVYYFGLSLMAGMGLAWLTAGERSGRRSRIAAGTFAAALLAVYLYPYWTGALTTPRNATSQTMALMPQAVSPAEGVVVRALTADPDDYRVTVWPTIAGPTGNVPEPPATSMTRNFALLGKDGIIGPTYIGEPYSMYLLGLLHRPWPVTGDFGRLLGLAAVRRVFHLAGEPYLSYSHFGWMPTTKRGPETLYDPGDILAPFIAAQADLHPDPKLAAPPVEVLENADFLPRLRQTPAARLAGGGFPLLLALANGPKADFDKEVLLFGSDVAADELAGPGSGFSGLRVLGRGSVELALPFLPADAYLPARAAGLSGEFKPLADRVLDDPRFGGAGLDKGGRVSDGPGAVRFPLVGHGSWRIFLRAGSEPFAGPATVRLDGVPVATVGSGPLGRGLDWIDCGSAAFEPGPPHELEVAAPGRGIVVSGLLAVPEEAYEAARQRVAALARGDVRVAAEAEEATAGPVRPMAPKVFVPLLAREGGAAMETKNARLDMADPMGTGLLAVEGDAPGEAVFPVRLPEAAPKLTLETYPRLFGDKAAPSYVEASVSVDGGPFVTLYRVEGKPDDQWEKIYDRRMVSDIPGPAATVVVRFAMRQAQLASQANLPNQPMRLVAETPTPGGATLSFGAAARLPAVFNLSAPVGGTYAATARLIGRTGDVAALPDGARLRLAHDGATIASLGSVVPDADGAVRLVIDGPPGAACDQIFLESRPDAPAEEGADPAYQRENPGRYRIDLPPAAAGKPRFLVFSEAFHPGWQLHLGGRAIAPVKGLGFVNVFALPPDASGPAELVYRDEAVMARLAPVAEALWPGYGLLLLALCLPDIFGRKGKAAGGD